MKSLGNTIDDPLESREFVVDSKFLKSISLFLLFSKEASYPCSLFFISLLSILLVSELYLGRHEFPLAIAVLESVFVGLLHGVAFKLSSEKNISVHCLSSN